MNKHLTVELSNSLQNILRVAVIHVKMEGVCMKNLGLVFFFHGISFSTNLLELGTEVREKFSKNYNSHST